MAFNLYCTKIIFTVCFSVGIIGKEAMCLWRDLFWCPSESILQCFRRDRTEGNSAFSMILNTALTPHCTALLVSRHCYNECSLQHSSLHLPRVAFISPLCDHSYFLVYTLFPSNKSFKKCTSAQFKLYKGIQIL